MADGGAPLQAETAMGGQQSIAGRVRPHFTVAQDKMRQNREYRLASGALNAPDGETAEANSGVMGVASQRAAAVTGRFMSELKTQGEDEGEDELDKCFAIVKELRVGGFIVEIDGDRANTQKIESKHTTLRARIKRLVRRTICFSKTERMHDLVIGLFISRYEFGRAL